MTPCILATCDADQERYYLHRSYEHAITKAGGALIIVPPSSATRATDLVAHADGLLLSGGDDIHPSRWGEHIASYYQGKIDEARDALEFALVAAALERGIPILGICRGMQLLNVFLGGSLYQHIPHELPAALDHTQQLETAKDTLAHDVFLQEGSRLAEIMKTRQITTNSFHHQGVNRLAPCLVASGWTADGLVEALEDPSHHFLIGVEWHPERLLNIDPRWEQLFIAFIAAATHNAKECSSLSKIV